MWVQDLVPAQHYNTRFHQLINHGLQSRSWQFESDVLVRGYNKSPHTHRPFSDKTGHPWFKWTLIRLMLALQNGALTTNELKHDCRYFYLEVHGVAGYLPNPRANVTVKVNGHCFNAALDCLSSVFISPRLKAQQEGDNGGAHLSDSNGEIPLRQTMKSTFMYGIQECIHVTSMHETKCLTHLTWRPTCLLCILINVVYTAG